MERRINRGAGRAALRTALLSTTILGGLCLWAATAHAVDGMWLAAPATADWNTGTNWSSTPSVPDGTASFGASTQTSLTFSAASTSIGTMQFNAGAPAYTFTLNNQTLTLNGAGIVDNSSNKPTFNLTGNVVTNFILNFTNAASAGDAIINASNSGYTQFFNTSTAANATFNLGTDGQVIFHDTSNAGSATFNVVNGSLDFKDSSSASNANIIIGAGADLSAFESFSTAGNAHITIAAGSVGVDFVNGSSAGNAVITNAGMVNFVGSSTATDPTILTPTAANATITNNAGGALTFGSFTLTFPGGVATLNPFIGTGSAGNATIINNAGGSTTFFNQSTAGTATITNNAGGSLLFANAGGSPVDPDASTARVINSAGGTVDISGVNAGVSIGSLSGAGNVFLGSKALTLGNLNGNDIISGVIADGGMSPGTGGQLIKTGTGDLTLTNTETYTGATTVNGGTLTVNGSIASSSGVSVNSGGTLAGTGTVAATTVNSGGTLAPGNGNLGTLTVNGNLTLNAGSIFLIDVTPTTASKAQVNGTANLAGTVEAVFLPGGYLTNSYTILTATGGRTGTFSNLVTVDLPAFLAASLTYDPNDVMLVTLRSNLDQPGLTQNQAAVASALDNSFNSGHGTLSGLSFVTAAQIPAALNALSGEGTSGTQETAFGAGDLFLNAMMEQGQFWRSGTGAAGSTSAPLGYAPDPSQAPVFKAMPVKAPLVAEPVYRAWFAGFDGAWHLDGQPDPGSATLSHNTAGGAAGLDYLLNPNLLVGVAAGGSVSTFSVPDRATSGTLDGAHIGTYGVGRWGAWYAAGALAFNAFDDKVTRTIAGVGPTEVATGKFDSEMLSGRFEVGYRQIVNNFAVTPFAAVQFAELWQAGYSESSTTVAGAPGVLGLTYAAQTVSSLPTFLGAQFDTRVSMPNGTVWSPYARLSWVHEFEPSRDVDGSFITLPFSSFTVFGPSAVRDAARIDIGSKLAITRQAALFASFEGEFSDHSQMYAGKGGFKFIW